MGRKDIYKDAKGFDVNPQNINRKGQPKKGISIINERLIEKGYAPVTKKERNQLYSILYNLPRSEYEELVKDKETPLPLQETCKIILKGGRNAMAIITDMRDWAHGKAVQATDVTTGGEKLQQGIDLSKLSDEALKEIINAARKDQQ